MQLVCNPPSSVLVAFFYYKNESTVSFGSKTEAADDVRSPAFERYFIVDKLVKFGCPVSNHCRYIRLKVDGGSIFDDYIAIISDRK